jgi:hypothetical protein
MVLKKIISIFTALFVVFSIPAAVFAEDNATNESVNITHYDTDDTSVSNTDSDDNSVSDDENTTIVDEEEAEFLSTGNGATMRLLMLQRQVELQRHGAEKIILKLEELNKSVDYDRLNEIVDELDAIVIEIEEMDMDQSKEELAETYVNLKSDATELSKEFKSIVGPSLTDAEKAALHRAINEKKKEIWENHKQRIHEHIRNWNKQKTKHLLETFGEDPEEILAKIESGELTAEDIKNHLKQVYRDIPQEEKEKIWNNLNEEEKKKVIQYKKKASEYLDKLEDRVKNHAEKIKERRIKYAEKLKERAENGERERALPQSG